MSPSSKKQQKKVVLASYTTGARERLAGLLEDHGLKSLKQADSWQEALGARTDAALIVLPLDHGFNAPDVAVLTEQDMLGDRLVRRKKRRKSADAFLAELAALTPGDLVVHAEHGIARYEGLTSVMVGKAPHDCVALSYAGGDKLYVPVENIDVLSRYGGDGERRDARPAGRRGVAAAQVADEGADPRDCGRADQDRRDPRHPRPARSRKPRIRPTRSSSTASPMRRPTTRTARSPRCWRIWRAASRWTGWSAAMSASARPRSRYAPPSSPRWRVTRSR